MCGVNLKLVRDAFFSGKLRKYPVKNTHSAPPHEAVIQCLVRTVVRGRIPPLQAALDHMDDPGNDPKVINARHEREARRGITESAVQADPVAPA